MAVTYDKLLKKVLLHSHVEADISGPYVNITGDTMTGDLEFPSTGFIMNDGTNRWRITINTSGALISTVIGAAPSTAGTPMGLLLALTYST